MELADKLCNVLTAIFGGDYSKIESAEVKMSERVQLKGERKFQEQYIVNEKGEKTAVVLPVGEYEELLEDLHDLTIIAERPR